LQGMVRGVVLASGVLFLGLVSGCCSVRPQPAEKYFPRTHPWSTLRGFVYAVDHHQWEYAYDSLSEGSREHVRGGLLGLEWFIRVFTIDIEVFGGKAEVYVYDLITNSLRGQTDFGRALGEETFVLRTDLEATTTDGARVGQSALLWFRKEEGEWRIDLAATIETLMAPGSPPPGDVTVDLRKRGSSVVTSKKS